MGHSAVERKRNLMIKIPLKFSVGSCRYTGGGVASCVPLRIFPVGRNLKPSELLETLGG